MRTKVRMSWLFDVTRWRSRVCSNRVSLTPLRFLMRVFWKMPNLALPHLKPLIISFWRRNPENSANFNYFVQKIGKLGKISHQLARTESPLPRSALLCASRAWGGKAARHVRVIMLSSLHQNRWRNISWPPIFVEIHTFMSIRPALGYTILDIDFPMLHTSFGSLELTLIREINLHVKNTFRWRLNFYKLKSPHHRYYFH